MRKFEYKAVYWANVDKDSFLEDGSIFDDKHLDFLTKELSTYGADGWELQNVEFDSENRIDGFWLFRREIV